MRFFTHIRPWLLGSALLAPAIVAGFRTQVVHAQAAANDPVEELRRVLLIPLYDPMKNPDELAFRRKNVTRAINNLRSVGDLLRALQLQAVWKDTERDTDVRKIDYPLRGEVAKRFREALQNSMRNGGPAGQLAAAELLEEVGSTIADSNENNLGGVTRPLAPDLVALLTVGDPSVRATAARALGKINPDPAVAAPALDKMIRAERDPAVRVAAVTGLNSLIQNANVLNRGGTTKTTELLAVSRIDVIQAGVGALPGLGVASADADPEVRRLAMEGYQYAGISLAEQTPEPKKATEFPPLGRTWTPEEKNLAEDVRKDMQAPRAEIMPLAEALHGQARALGRCLGDPTPSVRQAATRALEEISYARYRLRSWETSVPRADGSTLPSDDPLYRLIVANLPLLDDLLNERDLKTRLSMMNVLFWLGSDAKVAAPTLIRALSDPSKFMRWAAARDLGRAGPVDLKNSLPALARLLRDSDLDVRLAAAATLESYGPYAQAFMPDIIQRVNTGDIESRVVAIRVLENMGPDARPAVPALIEALGHEDARLQRAAAECLARGHFGEAARLAEPALERAMSSTDPEVRRAASEALLTIQQDLRGNK
jgi:HEAT repeat protein